MGLFVFDTWDMKVGLRFVTFAYEKKFTMFLLEAPFSHALMMWGPTRHSMKGSI